MSWQTHAWKTTATLVVASSLTLSSHGGSTPACSTDAKLSLVPLPNNAVVFQTDCASPASSGLNAPRSAAQVRFSGGQRYALAFPQFLRSSRMNCIVAAGPNNSGVTTLLPGDYRSTLLDRRESKRFEGATYRHG